MPTKAPEKPTLGLLYPGEMGTALGRLFRDEGVRVVTTLPGRSPRTHQNCQQAGLEELPSLRDVGQSADIVLSLVAPAAAVTVAQEYRDHLKTGQPRVYVDLNSIAPETAQQIAAIFAGTPVAFVDGGISGPAAHLCSRCIVYLSGAAAAQVAALFPERLRVRVLGTEPGQASTLRMLLSGLAKGVVALFVEMALAAQQANVLDDLLTAYQTSYPGIMELVQRSLPTFPRHAVRRGTEMQEVEATLAFLGLRPTIAAGIRQLIVEMGQCWPAETADKQWSVPAIIQELQRQHLLQEASEPAARETAETVTPLDT